MHIVMLAYRRRSVNKRLQELLDRQIGARG